MASPTATVLPWGGYQSIRRFSVDEYHRMIETGILEEDDPVELLEGYLVLKMTRNPPHDGTIMLIESTLDTHIPVGWVTRTQSALTLSDSQPEPDVAVVRGDERSYLTRHPGPVDVGLLVEVADASLDRDRIDKARVYARAGIPIYWVVNLVDGCIEVFTGPSGATSIPDYAQRQDFAPGADIPFILGGTTVAAIPVSDLLP